MPKFNISIPHALSQDEAKSRLDRFTESVGSSDQVSELEQSWEGNQLNFGFKTYGIHIKGAATVEDQQLDLVGELPMTAIMFKGKIESEIKKIISKLLAA